MRRGDKRCSPPRISPRVLRWFMMYARRMLRREFHGVRMLTTGTSPAGNPGGAPLVVYLNHSSWWDPLISLLLAERCFPGRPVYAPMEAAQLERYGIFKRLGVFGVEPGTARGARDFLENVSAILTNPDAMLWLTPQARFADARERPLRFSAGLAKLAQRLPHVHFQPLALEYIFWNERRPEVLAHLGESESGESLIGSHSSTAALTARFENSLTNTMNSLSEAAMSRDGARFQNLLQGEESVSGVYDLWRRLRAWRRGEVFHAAHSSPKC